MTKDSVSRMNGIVSIPAQAAIVASITSAALSADLAGYESATIVVSTGAMTTGDAKIHLVESSDNSTFTAVVIGDLIAGTRALVDDATLKGVGCTLGASDDNIVLTFGYRGSKRYIKAQATIGTTNGFFNVAIMRTHPRNAPVA